MDPHSPAHPVSFKRLMALETLGPDTYRSIAPAWAPGDGNRAFGGHVYAQAAYAAGKTVPKGMMLHVYMSRPEKNTGPLFQSLHPLQTKAMFRL
jgi:acyl-CoA thioesterase